MGYFRYFYLIFHSQRLFCIFPDMPSVVEADIDDQLPDDFLQMLNLNEAHISEDED